MRYAGIIYNDVLAAPGICLTVFVQGCHFHCKGCHNPETWDFNGGKEVTQKTFTSIINGLKANGIQRNLAIMGGEPLCPDNLELTNKIAQLVKQTYPNIKIYIWTGYLYEELIERSRTEQSLKDILELTDVIIDGPFIAEKRDITLFMRGSSNQRILYLKEK